MERKPQRLRQLTIDILNGSNRSHFFSPSPAPELREVNE